MVQITKEDTDFFITGYATGYPWIDYLTGIPDVFFPSGAVTEVMGLKSTAKTTLIFEAIARYHKAGGTKKTRYIDFEKTVKKQAIYLQNLGVDITNSDLFEYEQPATLQAGAKSLLKILQGDGKKKSSQSEYAFIVVDTVASMRPAQELENGFGETKQQGLRGKLMAELLRNLTADLDTDNGPAIIFVNQIYEEVNINKGPAAKFLPASFDSSASNALKYYASFRVTLTLKAKVKSKIQNPFTFEEDEVFVGSIIEAMAEKSKIGVPFRKSRFLVRYGYGIDPIPTMISAAINKPCNPKIILVEGKNSIYSYLVNDTDYSQRFKGLVEFSNFLRTDADALKEVARRLSPEWEAFSESFSKQEPELLFESEDTEEPSSEPDKVDI